MNVNDTITDGSVEYKLRQFASTSNIDDLGYRKPNTTYSEKDIVFHKNLPPGYFLQCINGGTTSNGNINVSGKITSIIIDGTVKWIKKAIIDKLEAFGYETIPEYADLNDYIYPGIYVSEANGISKTLQNCPFTDGNFKLIVNRNTYNNSGNAWWGQQIIITTHLATKCIYIRTHVDLPELWNPWQRVILEDDIFPKYNSAYSHNCIYRGKDLTSYFDSGEMSNDIANGSFKDIYIGDYITKSVTVDGTTYSDLKFVVMDLDYFWLSGNSTDVSQALRTHHVVLMPTTHFGTAQMNETNTTEGGYLGSKMWTETIPKIVEGIENAFGADHIVEHYEALTNAMDATKTSKMTFPIEEKGMTTNVENTLVKVNLANENQVFGTNIISSSGFEVGSCFNQFAAFKYNKTLINNYYFWWWLRTVSNIFSFSAVDALNRPIVVNASSTPNVRPYFLLK